MSGYCGKQRRLKRLKHDQCVNIAFRQAKRAWKASHDLEPHPLPQADCAFVGADDEVELHGPIPTSSSVGERVFAHAAGDASTHRRSTCHITAVTYVVPATALVWPHIISPEDFAVILDDERFLLRSHPVIERVSLTHCWIERVGRSITNGWQNDCGDGLCISRLDFPDQHGGPVRQATCVRHWAKADSPLPVIASPPLSGRKLVKSGRSVLTQKSRRPFGRRLSV